MTILWGETVNEVTVFWEGPHRSLAWLAQLTPLGSANSYTGFTDTLSPQGIILHLEPHLASFPLHPGSSAASALLKPISPVILLQLSTNRCSSAGLLRSPHWPIPASKAPSSFHLTRKPGPLSPLSGFVHKWYLSIMKFQPKTPSWMLLFPKFSFLFLECSEN